ncbi:hypothetical protein JL721_9533 [Aureococcus anophagefferens]|nr:hypothetical protein JL721_9533 [Aureococcus anophagefferens]
MRAVLVALAVAVARAQPSEESCEDSTTWTKNGETCAEYLAKKKGSRCKKNGVGDDGVTRWFWIKASRTCAWLATHRNQCERVGNTGEAGHAACPTACRADACYDAPCVDSTTWYKKDASQDCAWLAAQNQKKKKKFCKKKGKGKHEGKKAKGKDACPAACGECDAPVTTTLPPVSTRATDACDEATPTCGACCKYDCAEKNATDGLDFSASDECVDAGAGDDTVFLAGGTQGKVFGGDGDDLVRMFQSGEEIGGEPYRAEVHGGGGADVLDVRAEFVEATGQVLRVKGGDGDDAFTIVGDDVYVEAMGGSDEISVYGKYNVMDGGYGKGDVLLFNPGDYNEYWDFETANKFKLACAGDGSGDEEPELAFGRAYKGRKNLMRLDAKGEAGATVQHGDLWFDSAQPGGIRFSFRSEKAENWILLRLFDDLVWDACPDYAQGVDGQAGCDTLPGDLTVLANSCEASDFAYAADAWNSVEVTWDDQRVTVRLSDGSGGGDAFAIDQYAAFDGGALGVGVSRVDGPVYLGGFEYYGAVDKPDAPAAPDWQAAILGAGHWAEACDTAGEASQSFKNHDGKETLIADSRRARRDRRPTADDDAILVGLFGGVVAPWVAPARTGRPSARVLPAGALDLAACAEGGGDWWAAPSDAEAWLPWALDAWNAVEATWGDGELRVAFTRARCTLRTATVAVPSTRPGPPRLTLGVSGGPPTPGVLARTYFADAAPTPKPTPAPSPAPRPTMETDKCDPANPTCEDCCPNDCDVVTPDDGFDFSGRESCVCFFGDAEEASVTLTAQADCAFVSGDYATVDGGAGHDTIALFDGRYGRAYGGDGRDVITLRQSGKYMPAGDDLFSVADGGAGDDVIRVFADFARVRGGDGNDAIELRKAGGKVVSQGSQIWGGEGDDSVDAEDVKDTLAFGGDGADDLVVVDADRVQVDGGDGGDDITLMTVSDSHVHAGAGNDAIYPTPAPTVYEAPADDIDYYPGMSFLGSGAGHCFKATVGENLDKQDKPFDGAGGDGGGAYDGSGDFNAEEDGYCVTASGGDQNGGVTKLASGDHETEAQKRACMMLCAQTEGFTGCEVIWGQYNKGCYVHTQEVAKGNGPWGCPLTFDKPLKSAKITLTWKDQGWGNKKGRIPNDMQPLQPTYVVGGGGGYQLYVKDATLVVELDDDADVSGALGADGGSFDSACADSTTWHKKKNDKQNCAWVGKKAAKRCEDKIKSVDGETASDACPVACGACDGAGAFAWPLRRDGGAPARGAHKLKPYDGSATYAAECTELCAFRYPDDHATPAKGCEVVTAPVHLSGCYVHLGDIAGGCELLGGCEVAGGATCWRPNPFHDPARVGALGGTAEILQWGGSCPSDGSDPGPPGGNYNIGSYEKSEWDGDVNVQHFTGGTHCGSIGGPRTGQFYIVADLDTGAAVYLEPSEPSTCKYVMVLHTPPEGVPVPEPTPRPTPRPSFDPTTAPTPTPEPSLRPTRFTGDCDTVTGTPGDDCLFVAGDYATVDGGAGNDDIVLYGGKLSRAFGGAGEDRIVVNQKGENVLQGDDQYVLVEGGAGDDAIEVLKSFVHAKGGDGDDDITVGSADGSQLKRVHAWGGDGDDVVTAGHVKASAFNGDKGKDTLVVDDAYGSTVRGGGGDDHLTFQDFHDGFVYAGSGNDDVYAVGDHNVLDGGYGDTTAHAARATSGFEMGENKDPIPTPMPTGVPTPCPDLWSDAGVPPQRTLAVDGKAHQLAYPWRRPGLGDWTKPGDEIIRATGTVAAWSEKDADEDCLTEDCGGAGAGDSASAFGEEQAGYCVTSDGTDQNSGVVKLASGDHDTDEKKAECLLACADEPDFTGCEVIWGQSNAGCYVHTQEVARATATPSTREITLTWKDQGWGNKKGHVGLWQGDAKAHSGKASHSWVTETIDLDLEDLTNDGSAIQAKYVVGGAGGHQLYVKDATLVVTFEEPDPEPRYVVTGATDGACELSLKHVRYYPAACAPPEATPEPTPRPTAWPTPAPTAPLGPVPAPTPRPTFEPPTPAPVTSTTTTRYVGGCNLASPTCELLPAACDEVSPQDGFDFSRATAASGGAGDDAIWSRSGGAAVPGAGYDQFGAIFGGAGDDAIRAQGSYFQTPSTGNFVWGDKAGASSDADHITLDTVARSTVWSGDGANVVDVSSGVDLDVHGGAGADVMHLVDLSDSEVYGGAGDDAIYHESGAYNAFYGGDGAGGASARRRPRPTAPPPVCDRYNPTCEACCPQACDAKSPADGYDFSGAATCVCFVGQLPHRDYGTLYLSPHDDCAFVTGDYAGVDGGAGDDTIILGGHDGGMYGRVDGGDGDDVVFGLQSGADLGDVPRLLAGGAGDDAIYAVGEVVTILGGAGDDAIELAPAPGATAFSEKNQVWGGLGADSITAANVKHSQILGGPKDAVDEADGPNSVKITHGASLTVWGGEAADSIALDDVDETYVFGGAGDDDVYLVGTYNVLYGGDGGSDILTTKDLEANYNSVPEDDFEVFEEAKSSAADSGAFVEGDAFHSAPSTECADAPSSGALAWEAADFANFHCESIGPGADFEEDCARMDTAGVAASVACPVACGTCPAALCLDDDTFHVDKISTNCAAVAKQGKCDDKADCAWRADDGCDGDIDHTCKGRCENLRITCDMCAGHAKQDCKADGGCSWANGRCLPDEPKKYCGVAAVAAFCPDTCGSC